MIELINESVRSKIREQENGCWLWTSSLVTHGYAQVKLNGKSQQAHRFVYEQLVGKIPKGLELDHLCRVRNCVNPAHLEPVPHAENVRRGLAGAVAAERARSKTHCLRGHLYTEESTLLQYPKRGGNPTRSCRLCRQMKNTGKPALVTHCRNGHEYSESNTYHAKDGKRYCRACKAMAKRKARKARR